MSVLFETTTINNMNLKNRFVRSATVLGMANDDGTATARLVDTLVRLAHGGVGLIISGTANVTWQGRFSPRQLGAYADECLPTLTRMTEAVHEAGGKIVLQIGDGGLQVSARTAKMTGSEIVGPSTLETAGRSVGRSMTQEEIDAVVIAFGQAAARAKEAGFDGVQLHAAHGYLLSEFLSPFFNKRDDEYGGSVGNRARILLEVAASARAAVGDGFPVLVKINSEDVLDGGFTVEDMLQVAEMLEKSGIDAIELSGGGSTYPSLQGDPNSFQARTYPLDTPEREVYYREAARRYKEELSLPLMLVGGIRSLEVAEKLVEEGATDYISLCRPLICEPDLINRWIAGDTGRSECISCNECIGALVAGKGVHCPHMGTH